VPAAKITTRPFSMCRIARRRMKGSAREAIGDRALHARLTPSFSSQFCMRSAFITVASMPMPSACARSMPEEAPATPRKMLPPPITRQTCTPSATTSPHILGDRLQRADVQAVVAVRPSGPRPDTFSRTRL
jgi:hypothetical protein